MHSGVSFVVATISALSGFLAGCTPPGSSGGRLSVSDTLPSERGAAGFNQADAIAFAETAGAELVTEILSNSEIAQSPTRVVIELGDIANKGTDVDPVTFEAMQRRVRNHLIMSRQLKDKAIVTESLSRMQADEVRFGGSGTRTSNYAGRGYSLQGTFFMSSRGVRRYYLEFQLVNLETREVIFAHTADQAEGG